MKNKNKEKLEMNYCLPFITTYLNLVVSNPNVQYYPSGFDMITPTVAIGDMYSSYESFDVIVNLNCPRNGMDEKSEDNIKTVIYNNKTIYYVGIIDSPEEDNTGKMLDVLNRLVPELSMLYFSNRDARFLFHCYAGMSRSVAVAIAFLNKTHEMTMEEVLRIIVANRSIIYPNPLFVKELNIYLGQ